MHGFLSPTNLFFVLFDLLEVMVVLILAEVVVSWAICFGKLSPYRPWVRTLRKVTSPVLEPFRKIAPPFRMGGLDISPLLAIVIIGVIQQVLFSIGIGGQIGR